MSVEGTDKGGIVRVEDLTKCICGSWTMDGFYLKGCPIHDPNETDNPQEPWTDDDGMDP